MCRWLRPPVPASGSVPLLGCKHPSGANVARHWLAQLFIARLLALMAYVVAATAVAVFELYGRGRRAAHAGAAQRARPGPLPLP